MPRWDDYKSEARERGALALELYVIRSTPTGDVPLLQATLPDHLAYQAKLEEDGILMLAGPMSDDTGELMQGVGLVVYRAASMEEARVLADADPMHKSGARTYELRKWLVNEGSLNMSVGLSTRRIQLS